MPPAAEQESAWRDAPQEKQETINFPEIFAASDAVKEKAEGALKQRPPEVQIADILLRNEDFSYGVKRERALAFLKDALDKSPKDFAELMVNINAELKKRGSNLRLQAQVKEEKRVEEQTYIPAELGLTPYKYPSKRTTENVAILKVTNRFGETEDEAKIQSKPLKIEYNQKTRGEPEWKPLVGSKPNNPFQHLRPQ